MKYLHLFRHPSLWSRLLVAAALACALPACVKPEEVNYVQNLVLDQKASIGKEYKIVIKRTTACSFPSAKKNPTLAQMFNKDSSGVSSQG